MESGDDVNQAVVDDESGTASMSSHFEKDPEFDGITSKPRSGPRFRLIELLWVVAIIVVLIALLLPATRSSRPAARRAQCVNNLKQIVLALRNYEQNYNAFPPAYTVDARGRRLHSWRTLILPYLEQEALYRTIDLAKPWNDPANARALETPLAMYHCPESVGPGNTTTYLATTAPNGCLVPRRPRPLEEITDAPECTLLVIEAGEEDAVPWMAPVDADEALLLRLGPASKLHHVGGMNACYVDRTVQFLKASTPAPVRRAQVSISGDDDEAARLW